MSENVEDLLKEILRQLASNENDIRPNAQKLWDRLGELIQVPFKDWNAIDRLLLILTGGTIGVLYHARNAAKELELAESKIEKATSIIKGQTFSIFEFIECHVLDSATDGGDGNRNILIGKIRKICTQLDAIKGELEKLYDGVLEQTLTCVESTENTKMLQGITGRVGLVAIVATLSPWISLAIQIPPLSATAWWMSCCITIVSTFTFERSTLTIAKYKMSVAHLKRARSMLVDAKIAVETFSTNIDTLYIFQRMFDEDEMLEILKVLIVDFRKSTAKSENLLEVKRSQ